jgi:ribose transport system permease protein
LAAKYGTTAGLLLLLIIFSVMRPDAFFTISNMLIILKQGAILTMIALGLTVVLTLQEFDLSIGFLASFVGMITTGMMSFNHFPVPVAVTIGLGAGCAAGAINGLIVTLLKVPSLVATLGTGSALIGVTFLYSKGAQISSGIPSVYKTIGKGYLGGIPNLVLIMVAFAVLLWILMNRVEAGRRMYAIGGNPNAAWMSGISLRKYRILGFCISGFGAGLGGLCLAAMLGVGHPQAADGFLLDAFTAAFLGAVTLKEGEFHVVGTVIGVLILSVTFNGLTMLGVEFYAQNVIKGLILIGAVALSRAGKKDL